ncbi:hypothetical protein AC069_03575 [Gardnerella vaginalis]|uniref:hypothetical protein n=1 Tax=Gardnerella vaginalis TaxID=2702 RepID=UPI00065F8EE1|nr:hypothetical protein [Gardnerella vaginalis]KMT46798.1 hypothetical protein AC069_03575 [Gardnerella vaginalis]
MNNPSYLGTAIQYFHNNYTFNMNTERYDGQTVLHLDDLEITSLVNINNADKESAIDVVRQLTGKPQPKGRV